MYNRRFNNVLTFWLESNGRGVLKRSIYLFFTSRRSSAGDFGAILSVRLSVTSAL